MYEDNSFLTLTFSDEHLPEDGSIRQVHLQLFMKRLRQHLVREHRKHRDMSNHPQRIRFYACGEYGDKFQRPHYHAIIFNLDFPDKYLWRQSAKGYPLYRSATLERLWPFGHCEIGTVTQESGGYVARYCLKKINGKEAPDYYLRCNPETGEVWQVQPEFALFSNKPGLGMPWFDEFSGDCFPSDFIVINGDKVPVPRSFVKKFRERDPEGYERLAAKRRQYMRSKAEDNTPERLGVREESAQLKTKRLKREYEAGQ